MRTWRPVLLILALASSPTWVAGQIVVSTGVLVAPEGGPDPSRVGPVLSVGFSAEQLGLPLLFEASLGRTDFTSLGQDYHHNYYLFMLGAEWFPVKGATRVGLRAGMGVSGEYEIVEANPSRPGGDSWVEAVIPGLVLERQLRGGRRLVVEISDYVLGPFFAVLDPEEYGIEHRVRMMVGVRF